MPLSANLLRLESSILTRAKRPTNRNNVATEKRSYIFFYYYFFFRGHFGRGDFVGKILSRNPFIYVYVFIKFIGYLLFPSQEPTQGVKNTVREGGNGDWWELPQGGYCHRVRIAIEPYIHMHRFHKQLPTYDSQSYDMYTSVSMI